MTTLDESLEPLLEPAPPEPPEEPAAGRSARLRQRIRRWHRRRYVKNAFIWTHRWSSLAIGLALLVVTTTGIPLLYQQEITHAQYSAEYTPAGPPKLSLAEALPIVQAHDGNFRPQSLFKAHGVYVASNFETGRNVTVDPSNGKVLGDFNPEHGSGFVAWTMSLMQNIHVCGLTCPEYAGYQSWLNNAIPGTGWLGFDGARVTWGGMILGITGILLLFLALSGIWLWWPGLRRWFVGLRVRFRKGRYARDFDLHQVAGMIAVPLLLIWAFTGAGYEFGFIEKAWFGATPGGDHPPERVLESAKSSEPDIGVAAAIAAAQKRGGTDESPTALDIPAPGDPKATYGVWFADGYDPWNHSEYSGDLGVNVDRKNADRTMITWGGDISRAERLWEDWNFPMHTGWAVNPWWRSIWLVLGLTPLLLAFTGLSTWLYKRGLRKRRRLAAAAAA
jgi:uncharacterized iron-regulated membrane protein